MVQDEQPEGAADDPLRKAEKELQDAESRLEHARAHEAVAERDIKAAIEDLKKAEHDDRVKLHVTHVNEVESADFKEPIEATLQHVWNKAYRKMDLEKKPKDIFQTGGEQPKSLMAHLGLSLDKAKKEGVIADYRFGIASETGGA